MAALTTSQLAFCALIFGAGAATPTLVKKISRPLNPAAKQEQVVKRTPAKIAPKLTPAPAIEAAKPSNILDCPQSGLNPTPMQVQSVTTNVVSFFGGPNTGIWVPPGGGGGGGGGVDIPAIPEGDVWMYLIAGFGFVGGSLRRRKKEETSGA